MNYHLALAALHDGHPAHGGRPEFQARGNSIIRLRLSYNELQKVKVTSGRIADPSNSLASSTDAGNLQALGQGHVCCI